MLKPIEFPSMYTTLEIDAMYFYSAKVFYQKAKEAISEIKDAELVNDLICDKEKRILDKYNGDSERAYDELEPLFPQLEGAEYKIGAAYGPFIQNIVITHVLCTACAEAHINMHAKNNFHGKVFESFDKLTLEGKWLILPQLVGNSKFDPGKEPFQSFSKMIKYRNKLVHYKGIKEEWDLRNKGIPKFLDDLGITLAKAKKSIITIRKLFIAFAELIDASPPYWLRDGYDDLDISLRSNFFEIVFE